jgi:hypothetical protein
MTAEPLHSAAAAPAPGPAPAAPAAALTESASPPQPALAYRTGLRAWPWDVRVVIFMTIAWAVLQLLQGAFGIAYLTRQKNVNWFVPNYNGWLQVLGTLLRSLLPTLLLIGLIGLLKFKPGARRLSVLVAGSFVVFGILEAAAQSASIVAQRTYAYDVPGQVTAIVQNFIAHNALLIIVAVMLTRTDVKRLANDT